MIFHQNDEIRLMKAENLIQSRRAFNRERKGGKKQHRDNDYTPKSKRFRMSLKKLFSDEDSSGPDKKKFKQEIEQIQTKSKFNFGN